MNATQRTVLARSFAQEISNHYRNVVDLALHQPRTDPRNFHAHLLTTTREVTPQGFGAKTIAELNGTQRFELGLPRAMEELVQVRELWAEMTNEHLLQAGIEARVFHRRPEAAQVQREARPWLPRIAWEIEKRGERSIVGDRVRAQFNQRQAARQASLAKDSNALARQSAANWAAYRAGVLSEQNPETHRQRDSLRRELGHDGFSL
jgi:MobA/MobL family